MKLALYKNMKHSFFGLHVFETSTHMETSKEWLCVSEVVDVEFPMLPPAEAVQAELAAIDEAEAEFNDKVAAQRQAFKEQRSKLLAITHVPGECGMNLPTLPWHTLGVDFQKEVTILDKAGDTVAVIPAGPGRDAVVQLIKAAPDMHEFLIKFYRAGEERGLFDAGNGWSAARDELVSILQDLGEDISNEG